MKGGAVFPPYSLASGQTMVAVMAVLQKNLCQHTGPPRTVPVVMYRCESWIIKKAEHQRIDAFELSCWRRLLGVPWTSRRSNQSLLKEINPEYSFGGLMMKLQYFGHLMQRGCSLEKTLMLGKIEGRRDRKTHV